MGDHVIVVNARKVVFKGNKGEQKLYRHHTLYPGGLRQTTAKEMMAKEMMTEKIPLLLIVLMMIMETTVTITIMRLKRRTKMEIKEEPMILKNPMKRLMM